MHTNTCIIIVLLLFISNTKITYWNGVPVHKPRSLSNTGSPANAVSDYGRNTQSKLHCWRANHCSSLIHILLANWECLKKQVIKHHMPWHVKQAFGRRKQNSVEVWTSYIFCIITQGECTIKLFKKDLRNRWVVILSTHFISNWFCCKTFDFSDVVSTQNLAMENGKTDEWISKEEKELVNQVKPFAINHPFITS